MLYNSLGRSRNNLISKLDKWRGCVVYHEMPHSVLDNAESRPPALELPMEVFSLDATNYITSMDGRPLPCAFRDCCISGLTETDTHDSV